MADTAATFAGIHNENEFYPSRPSTMPWESTPLREGSARPSSNPETTPLSAAIDGRSDAAARESAETEERPLLYAAATRARKELLVLRYGVPGPLLNRD